MPTAGIIEELLVEENNMVGAGEVVMRLKGAENLAAAIARAEFELAAAEYDLNRLYKDTELLAAQAYQAVIQYKQEVKDATRYRDNLGTPPSQGDIDQAKANLLLAQISYDKAKDDFEPYEKKKEDNKIRAGLFSKLADAEKKWEDAARRYNNLLGAVHELDIEEAEADLALAKLNLQVSERDYEIYKHGPDPDDVRLAEERVANAQAQLAAAEAAPDDLVLQAPFAGTVSELYVNQNEWISPGQPVLLLADLDHVQVETTDLNEIDVARIELDDSALITFDALPEVEVTGKVVRIAPKADQGSGVNYTLVIELDEIPEKLRWGMTAFVDILVE
jgi:multidrug resistance efflux pump